MCYLNGEYKDTDQLCSYCAFVLAYAKNRFSNLIAGMLEDGTEDFSTSEDLFDAIGPLLGQVDDTKSDDDIREICDRLYNLVTKG